MRDYIELLLGEETTQLFDSYGRPLRHLRISVTGRCNFNCFFCHAEGYTVPPNKDLELSVEEFSVIAEAAKRVGFVDYKLTGGEPLIREDIGEIIDIFASVGGRVSITTNGSLLVERLKKLDSDKLDHINVSLNSLDREKFKKITGADMLDKVIEGIYTAYEAGHRIKINFVLLRGLNDNEVEKIVNFASNYAFRLQIIELHPVGKAKGGVFAKHHNTISHVYDVLKDRIVKVRYRSGLHARPILVLDNGLEVELVLPVKNPIFCSRCTRMRLTWDGKLLPCLSWEGSPPVDVREYMYNAQDFEDKVLRVVEAFQRANRLRRPHHMYTLTTKDALRTKRYTMRLGLPKSDGILLFVGDNGQSHLKKYLMEWND
ncbi:MAG TPA: GTP 3',8-cyclase MoaA [Pyrodictium sp.]|nr:GTP 3',8-cyclase MoaA [Pyrodictium sp.]